MTFLELCQRTRQECDIAGTGPSAVTNQTGMLKRVVDWVAAAYDEICAAHQNWDFLRSSFSFNTTAEKEAYLPTEITDTVANALIGTVTVGAFVRWIPDQTFMYLQSAGAGTQANFWPTTYAHFRQAYQLQAPSPSQPAFWAVRPRDSAILLGPKPNDVYVISGEYYRAAPRLTADDSAPLIPERYHLAIVWRAVQKYAGFEEDGGLYAHAENEYNTHYGELEINQLPRVELGQPLA